LNGTWSTSSDLYQWEFKCNSGYKTSQKYIYGYNTSSKKCVYQLIDGNSKVVKQPTTGTCKKDSSKSKDAKGKDKDKKGMSTMSIIFIIIVIILLLGSLVMYKYNTYIQKIYKKYIL